MKKRRIVVYIFLFVLGTCVAGCSNRFWDPSEIGRYRPTPAVNVILDSLGVAEEEPPAWKGAEDPKPTDIIGYEADYAFASGDAVRVAVLELLENGVWFSNDYIINETGKITVPEIGLLQAGGLTESQLAEEIRQILKPSKLIQPQVVVTLLGSPGRFFSILGDGIPGPGRYQIPRYVFRLTDALALAGSPRQFFVSNIYVSRPLSGEEEELAPIERGIGEPEEREGPIEPGEELLEIIAPQARAHRPDNKNIVVATTEMVTNEELANVALPEHFVPPANREKNERKQESKKGLFVTDIDTALEDILGQLPVKSPGRGTINKSKGDEKEGHIEWIFENGKWIPIRIGPEEPGEPAIGAGRERVTRPEERIDETMPPEFGWEQIGAASVQTRVIRIPVDKLLAGDPRYNIIIKPGDSIHVPIDIVGDFYIQGNVNFQGAISLSGRPMTLKMAIAAAGGLGPLAWPKRCEVVRRIGKDEAGRWREEIVMVDLDKIARGEQPDFFIKPNDLINVGTHPTARWRAVLRNAFRATYGFGFIYDRNFADRDFGTRRPIPNWF
jgi:polysaccharide export outer membrane protein